MTKEECINKHFSKENPPTKKQIDYIYKYYHEITAERIIHNNQEIKDIQRRKNITKEEAQKIIAFYEPIRKQYYEEGIIKKARLVRDKLQYVTYSIHKLKYHKYNYCGGYNEDIEDYTNNYINKDIDDCLNYCERNYFGDE